MWLITLLTCSSKCEGEVYSSSVGLRVATDINRELACRGNNSFGEIPRSLLLISFAMSHFLSQEDLTSFTGSMIDFCLQNSRSKIQLRPFCSLLNNSIRHLCLNQKSMQAPTYNKLNVHDAFSLWSALSKNEICTEMDSLRTDLILGLECILSALITDSNRYGLQSSIVMKCIENISVEAFVQVSVENIFVNNNWNHEDKTNQLLMSALSYDVSLFAPHLMKVIPKIDDIESAHQINQMNEIIATIVRECDSQNQYELSETEWFIEAVVIATEALCSMLSNMVSELTTK